MEEMLHWFHRERVKTDFSWENIYLANKKSKEALIQFLNQQKENNGWPLLTVEEWSAFIDEQHSKEQGIEKLIDGRGATIIHANNELNNLKVPPEEDSAWQTYRRILNRKGFSDSVIDIIEDATIKTLNNLSRNTTETGAIKGLVVGNVQSGKTANMTALMAMAADYGWNMFIILSGMMNNLKDQTMQRIYSDLKDSKLSWKPIMDPKAASPYGERLKDLDLNIETSNRYFTVCIKNAKRLKHLLNWINRDKNAKDSLRLLIIDDEADQASINTNENERSKINELILDLVNDRTSKHIPSGSKSEAINYIGYTATPYANVLNEIPGENSLYPKDFITSLTVSDEYFGPQQIFGYEADDADADTQFCGLDILRTINDSDWEEIQDIHNGESEQLPLSLEKSVCWFLDGVACMRLCRYDKPVSMLVHTSHKTKHHNNLSNAIIHWFGITSKQKKLEICREIWEKESERFTKDDFLSGYPTYGELRGGVVINPLPSFDEILPMLNKLLDEGITKILIDSEDQNRKFSQGIHLCVDNSSTKNNDKQTRLFYPEMNEMPGDAPAFLVIGGNTLSRGLTIEGLISTFFLRPAKCADSLMQMGRWFGYRPGYELLPRIWMQHEIKEKFEFISEMDQKLRDEIRLMAQIGISPENYGPKIMASPSSKWLQIVSKNKQQGAVGADYDFAGHTIETGVFDNKIEELESNMSLTREFLLSLGSPSTIQNNPYSKRNIVWKSVTWDNIRNGFLNSFKFSSKQKGFRELEAFSKWMDQMTNDGSICNWNIILAGVEDTPTRSQWELSDELKVNKVSRTQRTPDRTDGLLNIGVLRSFNDFVSDIEIGNNDLQLLTNIRNTKHTMEALNTLRNRLGLENTPLLVIYIIDKDSIPEKKATKRYPLNAVHDIVGFSIYIPGSRNSRNTIRTIQIRSNPDNNFAD